MEPAITIGDWVTNCPVCGGLFTQENVKGQVLTTCQSDRAHRFLVNNHIIYSQKGDKMHKLGVVLVVLSVMALVVIAFLRAPVGWLLIPAGVLAVWLIIRTVIEEKAKRDENKKIKP